MRVLLRVLIVLLAATACSGSSPDGSVQNDLADVPPTPIASPAPTATQKATEAGPGGYGFDRSDPVAGVANIMEAFATDEATATCVYEAWGDVANVPPAELTPELMAYRVCGTSILEMITGRG